MQWWERAKCVQLKGDQKKGFLFFGSFFQPTSNVGISETVCPNGLKFVMRIAGVPVDHFRFKKSVNKMVLGT